MIKGKFKYDNKTFKWKFKIEYVGCGIIETYAKYTNKILYKTKAKIYSFYGFNKSYKDIVLEYDSKSYKEIKSEVEEGIVRDYERRKQDEKFRKIESKFK